MRVLIYLLLLSEISAWSAGPESSHKDTKVVHRLKHVLQMILTRTCAANNMSIFVSTEYKEQLELNDQRLVDNVLDRMLHRPTLDAQVPIVLDRKLHTQLKLQVQLMLFFVQDSQEFQRTIVGNAGATATYKHKFLVVLLDKGEVDESQMEMSQIFGHMQFFFFKF